MAYKSIKKIDIYWQIRLKVKFKSCCIVKANAAVLKNNKLTVFSDQSLHQLQMEFGYFLQYLARLGADPV
jgi:hypothetical protein